ncbi:uncharacterized protein RSE6_15183 [Rhynchosporium secalis]|uniref:Uncharacterized protein n=1 Tax=Rhynchosporium secalis TaxID=38038 RepID=A0A1E1MWT3_RHYSE|nr:uncharacterized protein RSE6_15183 [Rhynchosporium secalis]
MLIVLMNLGPSNCPSPYMIFSTILVVASKPGELLCLFNKLNSKLYKYYISTSRRRKKFTKKAIFKAIISNTKGKRSLPSSSKIASDLDTPGPSLKKKAYRISYYTRSATRAILVNSSKELDQIVPVLDILEVLEAPETLGEKANKVEVIEEAEF